ncbi:MAG: hypothetical protein LBI69_03485 [Puniceicoccales bacterium]|jgi:D-alanine-D-alanine ligase|nr:hypothetical protein [Puniceicoccales bacterium]
MIERMYLHSSSGAVGVDKILHSPFEIVILSGAISGEREVSLRSGRNMEKYLSKNYSVRLIELAHNELPDGIDHKRSLIFPMVHGDFGEDGQLQVMLDRGDYVYIGSGPKAMQLTVDKSKTKEWLQNFSIPVFPEVLFEKDEHKRFSFKKVCSELATDALFLKPRNKGSSIHCHKICCEAEWNKWVRPIFSGQWMLEPLGEGKDLTIGVLHGNPLSIVLAIPRGEFLDYRAKYCVGHVQHIFPAPLEDGLRDRIFQLSRTIFSACNCKDWARIDFILGPAQQIYFLEINTIPGFTKTSFYPDSAIGAGMKVEDLVCKIVSPALARLISQ